MSQYDIDTVLGWRGNTVRDRTGDKIGTVGDAFLDRDTDRPAWIGVRTGLFGSKQTYVPLARARVSGDELHLGYDKEVVTTAPQIDPDVSLSAAEEDALYRHYGEEYAASTSTSDAESTAAGAGAGEQSAGAEDGTMIRSEEEVSLGPVERRPVERVRIKKVLVTENVTQVVPVRREVVQLEHEPPPAGTIESSEELPDQR